MLTFAYKVGGWGEKGQKNAYVIFEWSLRVQQLHKSFDHIVIAEHP